MGIFATYNPDYSGRNEIPDNLKLLFRPIAMVVPDYNVIAENTLFSLGFLNASSISKKICSLYDILSDRLS